MFPIILVNDTIHKSVEMDVPHISRFSCFTRLEGDGKSKAFILFELFSFQYLKKKHPEDSSSNKAALTQQVDYCISSITNHICIW